MTLHTHILSIDVFVFLDCPDNCEICFDEAFCEKCAPGYGIGEGCMGMCLWGAV